MYRHSDLEKPIRRARLRATGMLLREIAKAEGVNVHSIGGSLNRAVGVASELVPPGSVIPKGLSWVQRDAAYGGSWYLHGADKTPEAAAWAVDVLTRKANDASTNSQGTPDRCPYCGSPQFN